MTASRHHLAPSVPPSLSLSVSLSSIQFAQCQQYFVPLYKNHAMETLVIQSKSRANLKILAELARKLGEYTAEFSSTESEEFNLGILMNEEKTGKTVSRETIMRKLRSK